MRKLCLIGIVIMVIMICSCSSTKQLALQGSIREELVAGNYEAGNQLLDEGADQYKDLLVYNLDAAWIKFYNEEYEESLALFEQAESLIEERSAKSITAGIGTILLNENASDYTAESYEDVYCNIGLALCYYKLGKIEDALVEARKVNVKLVDYANNQKAQVSGFEKFVLAITDNPFSWTDDAGKAGSFEIPVVEDFSNSTFANYLSMLLYRAEGEPDEAVVDQNILRSNLGNEKNLVSDDDIYVPEGKARVNFISLIGLVPNKEEAAVNVWTYQKPYEGKDKNGKTVQYSGSWFYHKVAYPVILGEGTSIKSVAVECSNGETVRMSTLEDVGVVAKEALAMDTVSNYLRSYYRGYTKVYPVFIAADMLYQDSLRTAKSDLERALFRKIKEKSVSAVNGVESANLTMGSFLPGKVLATGMTLDPGIYDFTVKYTLDNGNVIVESFSGVEVSEKKLNLIVSKCAK